MKMRGEKRRDKVNPKSSQRKLNWIPSFPTYDYFNQVTLQLLDGFMITLSTDGVIICVAENISSLLGHLPAEIVGKKLLSLLPDEEKDEVYQKIILKFPLLNSETHIEFCCHLKRGNVEHGDSSAYENVKFIVNVRDICNEFPVVFSGLFSSHLCADFAACVPQEDRLYLVGNVCILRTQLLQQLYTSKAVSDEAVLTQDSDEEPFVGELSSSQGQRGHTSMKAVYVEPAAAAAAAAISDDQIDIAEVEQYGPQENVHMFVDSDSTYCSSTVFLDTMPESPALSLQDFRGEPEVNPLYRADPVDLEFSVDQVDSVDQEGPMDQQDPENPVAPLDQAGLMDPVDPEDSVDLGAAGASAQPLQPSSPVAYDIISQELELMKKLKEQLEERTWLLHDAIQNQQNALELMMDHLQKQPNTLRHVVIPDLQSSEAVPKKQQKQHAGQVKRPLPHPKDVKCFCGLSLSNSLKNTGELQEPCVAFNQQLVQQEQHLKEQQRQLREQLQQLREQRKVQKQKKMQEKKKLQEQKMQEKKKLQEQRRQKKKKLQERKKWQGQMLQKEPEEEQQKQQLQEQPLKHNVIVGNERVQICLQNPRDVSVPLCNHPVRFLQAQPIVPVQRAAEQQPSGFYQDENCGQQEDESQSFYPEAYQGPPVNQLPLIDTSNSEAISSSSIPQFPITSDSTISTLETPQDYIRLWQELSDSLGPVVQVNTWSCDEQGTLHGQPTYHQVQVSEVGVEGPPDPQAFQGPAAYQPDQMRSAEQTRLMPAEQRDSNKPC
ncbi:circadian clock protein PASD1 isoform X1 [Homo sapiens]|uniref:circadian clock protein PASD1 isoform X1 n=1 Tax=Homo sapiens TaxID=9606 RepID=UPI0005D00452|nr:circadian clock protein PASD1 isoform X1 [Homo sapiens]XP_054182434.1 circadian clock protein PASD1 isoform X1 [Homo sapiens]|eukprot:XP_011529404.1 circadian clock protein PASD1 isoform X1 [Homo sapiens]